METQFVTDKKGKKLAVILSISEYKAMLDKFDLLEDIKLYDNAKENFEDSIVAEEAFEFIEKKR